MMPNDNSYPRKLSIPLQHLDTSKPSNQTSSTNSNQALQSYTVNSNLPTEQEKPNNNDLEEEKAYGNQEAYNRNKLSTLNSEMLSPIEFLSLGASNVRSLEPLPQELNKQESERSDSEGHRIYGKYAEEYKKKYPNDAQHLKISTNGSPPEYKKSERMAFRRICNNNSLGETLVSEFIQDPLPDKESNSKSSKLSSNENLVDLYQTENKKPQSQITRPERVSQPLNRLRPGPQEIDPSIDASEEDFLKLSDLEALHRKRALKMQEPVNFNVMVMGESGLGKSTFIDCFLESKYDVKDVIRPRTQDFIEKEGQRSYKGMKFKIKLIDAPGYNHSENIELWYKRMKEYIIQQFITYKEDKRRQQREKKAAYQPIEDRRIHMMLYFLSGPRIRSRDLQLMKKFRRYCNIVPVLARGDSYVVDEIREMKEKLIEKAHNLKIDWFDFAEALKDSPDKLKELTECKFGPCPPFLLISSVSKVKVGPNQFVYGRKYPWGLCNIEDPAHSDFKLLQTLLGGHICSEAILLTNYYYKEYITSIKEKKKAEEELERKKNLGLGAVVVVGVVGAIMAVKKKFNL